MEEKFKVGDIVEFGGVEGVVVDIHDLDYPVVVLFQEEGRRDSFTRDGRYLLTHTKPLLNLISRPKKKVKKEIVKYFNIFKSGVMAIFSSKEDALCDAERRNIYEAIAVEVRGEYEVEE